MADDGEGFRAAASLLFARSNGGELNAGMIEAASEESDEKHKETMQTLTKKINDSKEFARTFRLISKTEMNNDQLWVIGEKELGAGLPVFIPHEKFGQCLAVKGTIRELWNEPGVKEVHFLVRRLHPMSVEKQNDDHAHFLVPIRCRHQGINIPWLLPVPIGLVNVEVAVDRNNPSVVNKNNSKLTMILWKNKGKTVLSSATLEEVYQVMNGELGDEKKQGMKALMEIQKKAYPKLFSKYLERSVSFMNKYGGGIGQERALNGGDGPSILMQDRVNNDVNAMIGVLGAVMPLALEESTEENSNSRIASMFIISHAPWMRASFVKLYKFPDVREILKKKHMVTQREERAVKFSQTWTVLNKSDVNEIARHSAAQVFQDSFSTLVEPDF